MLMKLCILLLWIENLLAEFSILCRYNAQYSLTTDDSVMQTVVDMPVSLPTGTVGETIVFGVPSSKNILGVVTKSNQQPSYSAMSLSGNLVAGGTFAVTCGMVEVRGTSSSAVSCIGNIRPAYMKDYQYELRSDAHNVHHMKMVDLTKYKIRDENDLEVVRKLGKHRGRRMNQRKDKKRASNSIHINNSTMDDVVLSSRRKLHRKRRLVDSNDILDVMVVYTADAVSWSGSNSSMELLILLAMDEANEILANSNVELRLRLVRSMHSVDSFTDPSSMFSVLEWITYSGGADSIFDTEQSIREVVGADVLSVFVGPSGYCGVAYLADATDSDEERQQFATSVVAADCATGYFSFLHEIGHNMGLNSGVFLLLLWVLLGRGR